MDLLKSEVSEYKGRPTLFIDDTPVPPVLYALTDTPGGRWSWEEIPAHNINAFAGAGARAFQVDVFLGHLCPEDGRFNLDLPRRQIRGVVDAWGNRPGKPAVFIRFHLNPPSWWREMHTDQLTVYDGEELNADPDNGLTRLIQGDAGPARRISLASETWADRAEELLITFCKEFSTCSEAAYLAGIQPAWGIYGEWHYWGFMHWEADFSTAMNAAFRRYLRDRYDDDSGLQKAWGDPSARIDDALVPGKQERLVPDGIFRDPVKGRRVIDYYDCQHRLVADLVVRYCRTVKQNWPVPIVTGSFYGYFFSTFGRQAAGGHCELHTVLKSQWIDYLAGPQSYGPEAEEAGDPYRSRGLLESVLIAGKLWLDEYDQEPRRTFAHAGMDKQSGAAYASRVRANCSLIARSMMHPFCRGMGLWFYDFGPGGVHLNKNNERAEQFGSTGFWDKPAYIHTIKNLIDIAAARIEQEYRPASDVLLVYDTKVMYHIKSVESDQETLSSTSIDWLSLAAYRAGFVFDTVHLEDIGKIDPDRYKLVIFANTFLMKDATRRFITERYKGGGRHLVWVYAPGYTDGSANSARFVADMCEMDIREITGEQEPSIEVQLGRENWLVEIDGKCRPLFEVRGAEAVGRYRAGGAVGAAKALHDGWTSWYFGLPPARAGLLRAIAREAGAHVYTDTGDIVYSGAGLTVVHTASGGPTRASLRNGRVAKIDFKPEPSTAVLDSDNGEVLFRSDTVEV